MIFDSLDEAQAHRRKLYRFRLVLLTHPGGPLFPDPNPNLNLYDAKTQRYDEARDWCVEHMGWHVPIRGLTERSIGGHPLTRYVLDTQARWVYSFSYFGFQYQPDAVHFRLRWPCREWSERDDLPV
ncbi:MAG: hypothetical protein EOP84_02695 [Verrucomicrobiaceae bacterium]|nr:MAG: hypothetical protein EOP84_02695 [Verrucomicrobiaceae bacterium]